MLMVVICLLISSISVIFPHPLTVICPLFTPARQKWLKWLKQISATDWPRTKSWDISLDLPSNNQVDNIFCRISNISVTCPHAQLIFHTVIKKLWTFFGPWGRDRSQSLPCCKTLIFRVKRIQKFTASETTRPGREGAQRRCSPSVI